MVTAPGRREVVRAMVMVIGMVFILLNLLVDMSYRYLDPRIRL